MGKLSLMEVKGLVQGHIGSLTPEPEFSIWGNVSNMNEEGAADRLRVGTQ